jgi:hypothetical protein
MRVDFSWTDEALHLHQRGTQFRRVEDWPDEWGIPRIDEEVSLPDLVGLVTSETYVTEPREEGGEGYSVVVLSRTSGL